MIYADIHQCIEQFIFTNFETMIFYILSLVPLFHFKDALSAVILKNRGVNDIIQTTQRDENARRSYAKYGGRKNDRRF